MRIIDAAETARLCSHRDAVEALREGFRQGCEMPPRLHYTLPDGGGGEATLLVMPAWRGGSVIGVKLATVFPANGARGLQAVQASYLLMRGDSGEPVALIDGGELTARRTAATSVLAAGYLARKDARRLLIVGTGRIARHAALCYSAVRPALQQIAVWGRDGGKAQALAKSLEATAGVKASAAPDLHAAVHEADIVSCATLSTAPLVLGTWLQPGCHLDLIGGFTPQMREADDAAVARARVFADNVAGAAGEAGDLIEPIANGTLMPADIGSLSDLCNGRIEGRRSDEEITLFKSVGSALEDLAVAERIWRAAAA